MSSMELFAKRLNQFVKEMGWSQEAFAARAGISQGSAWLYLHGKREPSLEIIDRIAKAVGVPVRVFFEDVDMPIMRYIPTATDALKILERAITSVETKSAVPSVGKVERIHPTADMSHWVSPYIEPLAAIKEHDDMKTVSDVAKTLVKSNTRARDRKPKRP